MIIIWILVIWAIVWFIRYFGESAGNGSRNHIQEKSPLDILKERYAKGEIKKNEFEEKKKDLS